MPPKTDGRIFFSSPWARAAARPAAAPARPAVNSLRVTFGIGLTLISGGALRATSSISGGHFARRTTTARSRPPRTPLVRRAPTGVRLTPDRRLASSETTLALGSRLSGHETSRGADADRDADEEE